MGMSKVLIVVNAEVNEAGKIIAASPATEKMVSAIRYGIANYASETPKMEIIAAAALWSKSAKSPNFHDRHQDREIVYCPLTIELPDSFDFPAKSIFSACRNIGKTRQLVEHTLGYKTCVGDFALGHLWLPIVLTKKGPLYAEVIGEGAIPNSYEQPIDLPNRVRQSLYSLAFNLLEAISALPAVYLLQFSLRGQEIIFDRLWPFPAAPALASLRSQDPDLYTCHWYCLTDQPIVDLTITQTIGY
jgi:hypothetical protein